MQCSLSANAIIRGTRETGQKNVETLITMYFCVYACMYVYMGTQSDSVVADGFFNYGKDACRGAWGVDQLCVTAHT